MSHSSLTGRAPARSDSVQEFFRSSPESNPCTYANACSRGSDLAKRRPIRACSSASPSAHSCTCATQRSSPITAGSDQLNIYLRRHAEKTTTTTTVVLDRVFRPWHITNPTTQLYVNWSYPDAVLAAGQATQSTVGFGQGAPAFELFPGQYTIAIADNPLYTATATAAAPAGDVPLQLQPALKPTVQPEVEKQVAALIAKCTTLLNDAAHGCPYQTNETQSVTATSVAWTINVQPQFAVGFSEGGSGVVVTTTQQGEATPVITYRDSNNVINTLDGQQVSFSVDGSVTAPGGAVTYAYGVGE